MSGTKDKKRGKQAIEVVQLVGKARTINAQSIKVLKEDSAGNILLATGTVAVTDGGAGFAKGALYIKTDVGAGTSGLYENVGTTAACNFDLVGSGAVVGNVFTLPQINDTSSDHQYVFAVNELAADRTVTLPLLVGNDTFVFESHIQTLTNKTLTSPVLTTPQINDTSADHQYVFAVSELAADRTVTLPQLLGNDVFVFEAFIQTLTNKTIDCDANTVSNVNGDELDPIAFAAAGNYGIPFVIPYVLANQAAAVNVFNANCPFKLRVIKAWSVATSADGGTWKLNNGAAGAGTDITNAVTVAASDTDFDEPTDYDDAAWEIAANGSLSIVPDGAGLLDAVIFIQCMRVN